MKDLKEKFEAIVNELLTKDPSETGYPYLSYTGVIDSMQEAYNIGKAESKSQLLELLGRLINIANCDSSHEEFIKGLAVAYKFIELKQAETKPL